MHQTLGTLTEQSSSRGQAQPWHVRTSCGKLCTPAAVQLGLFEVHRRVIEGEEPIPAAPGQPQGILTRMLVCHSQAGSIIGK